MSNSWGTNGTVTYYPGNAITLGGGIMEIGTAAQLRELSLSKSGKLLKKYGLKTNGVWSQEARTVVLDLLLDERQDEIIGLLEKLEATKKKGK